MVMLLVILIIVLSIVSYLWFKSNKKNTELSKELDSAQKELKSDYIFGQIRSELDNSGDIDTVQKLLDVIKNKIDSGKMKYVKMRDRIPVRFLKNTILFGTESSDVNTKALQTFIKDGDNDVVVGDSMVYDIIQKYTLKEAINTCNGLNNCTNISYSSEQMVPSSEIVFSIIEWDRRYVTRENDIGEDFRITKLIEAIIIKGGVEHWATRVNLFTLHNLIPNFIFSPQNIVGKREYRLTDIANINILNSDTLRGTDLEGTPENMLYFILLLECEKVSNVKFGSDKLVNNVSPVIRNSPNYNVVISRPELINWINYDYTPIDDTINLTLLNSSNGILFRNTAYQGVEGEKIDNQDSLEMCLNTLKLKNPKALALGKNWVNGKFWAIPLTGSIILKRNTQGVQHTNVYLLPNVNDIDFDF